MRQKTLRVGATSIPETRVVHNNNNGLINNFGKAYAYYLFLSRIMFFVAN